MKLLSLYKTGNWLNAFALLIVSTLFIASCKKPNDAEYNKGDTPLALSIDKTSIVLKQINDASDALTFSWTSGTNKGTNAAISYKLQVDKKGSNFSNPMNIALGNAVLSNKYSVKDLNDSLLSHWNLAPGVEAALEARVISAVADNLAPSETSNTISFKATPYQPVSTTLYLIGGAAPTGWNAGSPTVMTAVAGQSGKFTWTGNLAPGDFKFITTLNQFLPSYNKGTTNTSLVYRTSDTDPDDKFTVTTAGTYTVAVDLLNLTISVTVSATPPYTKLWIVGDATPNGWDINNPNQMRLDSSNLWLFTYNEVLNAGEFKIPVATGNWGTDFYMPATNHPAITETSVQFVSGGSPDNKWQITNPGPYKINLNTQNNTISIKPFTPYTQIWMVGDATPVGWNIDNPQPMTPIAGDPYKFEYVGPMNVGEFKFPLATGNWGCDYFMPVIDQSGIGSTQMKFVASGNPDNKWRLTQAGNYQITIDLLRETISIVKQ
jgi:starch-binding outer membrane protein SusE/F